MKFLFGSSASSIDAEEQLVGDADKHALFCIPNYHLFLLRTSSFTIT